MNIKAVSTNKSTGLRKTDQLYPLIQSFTIYRICWMQEFMPLAGCVGIKGVYSKEAKLDNFLIL